MGSQLGLDPKRCYENYETLLRQEAALPASERVHFIAIVTLIICTSPLPLLQLNKDFMCSVISLQR